MKLKLLRPKVVKGTAERRLRQIAASHIGDPFSEPVSRLATQLGDGELRDRAIGVLNIVRADPGKDVNLTRLLAKLLIKAGHHREAEFLLRQLVSLDYRALTDLVELLTKSGRREESVPLLRDGMDTYGAKARYLLATVQRGLGNTEEADRLLRSAADEGVDEAIQLLLRQLLAESRTQEAVTIVERASQAGRSDSLRRGAIQLYNAGHEETALTLLRGAAVCANADTLRLLSLLLERMGRREEAVAVARRGLTSDGSTASD